MVWGLVAALGWGSADVLGAVTGRRIGSLRTAALAQSVSLVAVWVAILAVGPSLSISGPQLAALAGSVLFYVVTNFAVWVTPNGLYAGLYAHTWDGLIQCYVMALPFFRNDIAGNVLWTAMLFGLFDLMQLWIKSYRTHRLAH